MQMLKGYNNCSNHRASRSPRGLLEMAVAPGDDEAVGDTGARPKGHGDELSQVPGERTGSCHGAKNQPQRQLSAGIVIFERGAHRATGCLRLFLKIGQLIRVARFLFRGQCSGARVGSAPAVPFFFLDM